MATTVGRLLLAWRGPNLVERLTDALARIRWEAAEAPLKARPPSPRPTLVVMAGVPLSGKTTLARALAASATTRTVHIENDALREDLARAFRRPRPTHDPQENFLTYHLSWLLAGKALAAGANAVHDGTSLTETGRKGAYKAADAVNAAVVVIIVHTGEAAVAHRLAQVSEVRRAAHAKLGHRVPEPQASRPFLVVEGAAPVEETLERLRAAPHLAALWAQGP